MSDHQDQFRAPIRANRDDDRPRPVASKGASGGGEESEGGSRWLSGGLINIVMGVVLLATLAVVWFQSREVASLRQQFDELDGLIKSTDESLNQSGTALSLKIKEQGDTLDKHWSEIKKLWGISYDRNRKDIAQAQKTADNAGAVAKQAQATAKQQQDAVAQVQKSLEQLDKQIKDVAASLNNLSSSTLAASLQLEEIETKVSGIEAKTAGIDGLKKELANLKSRTADSEAALKALDVYRSQVNQQLNQLRQAAQPKP
jgi:chromosome segregation ATPase